MFRLFDVIPFLLVELTYEIQNLPKSERTAKTARRDMDQLPYKCLDDLGMTDLCFWDRMYTCFREKKRNVADGYMYSMGAEEKEGRRSNSLGRHR